jgi:hypothetical protein
MPSPNDIAHLVEQFRIARWDGSRYNYGHVRQLEVFCRKAKRIRPNYSAFYPKLPNYSAHSSLGRMKVTLGIIIVLACCAVGAVLLHYRWVRPHLISPHGGITFREGGGPGIPIAASSPEVASIMSWIDAHQTGWHLSFVTYAPHATLSSDTFHINVGDNFVVLNYARHEGHSFVELVRDLPSQEQLFWRGVISRLKQPNQAMQPTAGRCTDKVEG